MLFVPGFKGSRLVDPTSGRPHWLTGSIALSRGGPSLARDLPELGVPAEIDAVPAGVLDRVAVAGPLWGVDVYRPFLRAAATLPGTNLTTFSYDWRGDLLAAAGALRSELAALAAAGRPATVVAHSTGGLIAAAALAAPDAPPVRGLVLAAVPFGGLAKALRAILIGDPVGRNRALLTPLSVATFPSCIQLLPPPGHRLLVEPGAENRVWEVHDPATWERLELGLLAPDTGPGVHRRARLEWTAAQLARAAEFRAAVAAGPAPSVTGGRPLPILRIVGTGRPTLDRMLVTEPDRGRSGLVLTAKERRRIPALAHHSMAAVGDATVPAHATELPPAWAAAAEVRTEHTTAAHGALLNEPDVRAAVARFVAGL